MNRKGIKKLTALLLVIVITGFMGCTKKKKNNNALLLLAAYFLTQDYATVTVTATITDSSGITMRDAKLTLSDADNVAAFNGSTSPGPVSDYTSCQTDTVSSSSKGTGLDGEFVLNFKVKKQSSTYTLTGLGYKTDSKTVSCSNIANYSATDFTTSLGTSTMSININPSLLTSVAQVTIPDTGSGYKFTIKSVSVVLAGTYDVPNPTVGENICDGANATSPETISGEITSSRTITNSAILDGTVTVKSGATLTISPGAVVFGNRGSSLFVLPGASLVAEGTATNPICFTSSQLKGSRFPGDWGGVVLIGNGSTTRNSTTEGTTPQSYPGTSANNSRLKYVIIEFAGNEVAPGDELNGLSMYSMTNSGSDEALQYVQVHRGLDDAFEWWGGNIKGKYLLGTGNLDDDFDMDEGYGGAGTTTLQYLISHKYPTSCGGSPSTDPHGMEMDGINSSSGCSTQPCTGKGDGTTNPIVSNYTLIGQSITGGRAARHREGMRGTFSNGLAFGFATGITCQTDSGFPASSTAFSNIMSDKAFTSGSASCTGASWTADTSLTRTTALESVSDMSDCGFGSTRTIPDYSTKTAYSTYQGAYTSSVGKWWSGWTVYRAR